MGDEDLIMVYASWDERFNELSDLELERLSLYCGEVYAENTQKGVYKCNRCKTQLFTSEQKYIPKDSMVSEFATFRASGSGSVEKREDVSFGISRTAVMC